MIAIASRITSRSVLAVSSASRMLRFRAGGEALKLCQKFRDQNRDLETEFGKSECPLKFPQLLSVISPHVITSFRVKERHNHVCDYDALFCGWKPAGSFTTGA